MDKKYRCQYLNKEQTWDMDHDEAKAYVKSHPGWHIVLVPQPTDDSAPMYSPTHPRGPWWQRFTAFFRYLLRMGQFSKKALAPTFEELVREVHDAGIEKQQLLVRDIIMAMSPEQRVEFIKKVNEIYNGEYRD